MISIKTIGSGSTGNAFVLSDSHTKILLECGLPFHEIGKALDYDFRDVVGCLITHEHADHCKGVAGLTSNTSISVLASEGTVKGIKALDRFKNGLNGTQVVPMVKFKRYDLEGGWSVAAFDVVHEGNDPTGFLIQSKEGEKILFATDTSYIKYIFNDLTHIIVEANYSEDILNKMGYHEKLKSRIRQTHFELDNVIRFINASKEVSDRLQHVFIVHTSTTNGDPKAFQKKIQEETGIYTETALENMLKEVLQ